jgi:hypothetical protein
MKPSGKGAYVRSKRSRIDARPTRMKQDERIPAAVLGIPGANTSKGHVVSHQAFSSHRRERYPT